MIKEWIWKENTENVSEWNLPILTRLRYFERTHEETPKNVTSDTEDENFDFFVREWTKIGKPV